MLLCSSDNRKVYKYHEPLKNMDPKEEFYDGRTPAIRRWETRKLRALARGDFADYARACDALGQKPEFPDFYERGRADLESDLENLAYNHGDFQVSRNMAERERWGNITKIALKRFPELERGERISVTEIKRRLGQIRKAGYDVRPYSKMRKEEAWGYLMQIRREVYEKAGQYCPEVLAEIKKRNMRQKRDARKIR